MVADSSVPVVESSVIAISEPEPAPASSILIESAVPET
jgi:hypothetical protein